MEDPLSVESELSLFSRNLPFQPSLNHSLHPFLLSMGLKSPNRYLEQAKTIVDNSEELLNPKLVSFLTENNEHEAVVATEKDILRERRPGMGRKKAQFKMTQNFSQPPLSSKPLSDAELSKDPREFFAYHERREKADNELKRLRGESVSDSIDFSLPRPERQRRPGLLPNRKPAAYKHLYPPSTLPQINDTSQPEAVDSRAEVEKNLTGSIAASENRINSLFDELLSGKDLDGDEISALVLDRLQIKPTLDEIPIPVFQVSREDTNSRRALSNIQNLPLTVDGKALVKEKVVKSLSQSLASSLPPLSPFAPISAFQKHIQQSNLSNDRFSALDLSPRRNFSSPGHVDEQSNHLESSTSELKSPLPGVNASKMDNPVSLERITDGNALQYDESVKDQFSRVEVSNKTMRSTDADFGVEAGNEIVDNMQVDDVGEEAMLSAQGYANAESSSRIHTDFQTAESDESHENVEVMFQNDDPSINADLSIERMKSNNLKTDLISPASDGPSDIAEVIPVQHTQNMEEPSEVHLNQTTTEIPPGSGRKNKEVCPSPSQSLASVPQNDQGKGKVRTRKGLKRKEAMEVCPSPSPSPSPSQSLAGVPQNDQGKGEVRQRKGLKRKDAMEALEVPLNDLTNGVPPPKNRKKKEFSRRSSLAAAGSQWGEGGVRRSNRVAVKPLKYWKGERFVYGRLHESLATVIGLKYDSPEKGAERRFDDKRNLKVKSFVSAEYEELVNQRALY